MIRFLHRGESCPSAAGSRPLLHPLLLLILTVAGEPEKGRLVNTYGSSDNHLPTCETNVRLGYDDYRKGERGCEHHLRHGGGVHASYGSGRC
jgi:hypothetical protein